MAAYLNSAHLKISKNGKNKFPKILEKLVYDHLKLKELLRIWTLQDSWGENFDFF